MNPRLFPKIITKEQLLIQPEAEKNIFIIYHQGGSDHLITLNSSALATEPISRVLLRSSNYLYVFPGRIVSVSKSVSSQLLILAPAD